MQSLLGSFWQYRREDTYEYAQKRVLYHQSTQYDHHAVGLSTALRFKRTVFRTLIYSTDFRAFIFLHFVIRIAYFFRIIPEDANEEDSIWHISWKPLRIIAAMTAFFLVFFTMENYSGYRAMHNDTQKLLRKVIGLAFLIQLYMGQAAKQHMCLGCRYLLGSLILFYEQLQYKQENNAPPRGYLTEHVLSDEEREYLASFDIGHRPILLMQWTQDIIVEGFRIAKSATHHDDSVVPLANNALKHMLDKTFRCIDLQNLVMSNRILPVPFQYFHLLNLMLFVNIVLWAYILAISNSWVASLVFITCFPIFMAAENMAIQLQDPFGHDEVDFPIEYWLVSCWAIVRRIQRLRRFSITDIENLASCQDDWTDNAAQEILGSIPIVIPFKSSDYDLYFDDLVGPVAEDIDDTGIIAGGINPDQLMDEDGYMQLEQEPETPQRPAKRTPPVPIWTAMARGAASWMNKKEPGPPKTVAEEKPLLSDNASDTSSQVGGRPGASRSTQSFGTRMLQRLRPASRGQRQSAETDSLEIRPPPGSGHKEMHVQSQAFTKERNNRQAATLGLNFKFENLDYDKVMASFTMMNALRKHISETIASRAKVDQRNVHVYLTHGSTVVDVGIVCPDVDVAKDIEIVLLADSSSMVSDIEKKALQIPGIENALVQVKADLGASSEFLTDIIDHQEPTPHRVHPEKWVIPGRALMPFEEAEASTLNADADQNKDVRGTMQGSPGGHASRTGDSEDVYQASLDHDVGDLSPRAKAKAMAKATPEEVLADGWQSGIDPATGRTYYFKPGSQEVRWDKPTEAHEQTAQSAQPQSSTDRPQTEDELIVGDIIGAMQETDSWIKKEMERIERNSGKDLLYPGFYQIVIEQGVHVTTEVSRYSKRIKLIPKGKVVEVLQVEFSSSENRIRGRIPHPAGWISLDTIQREIVWARPMGADEDVSGAITDDEIDSQIGAPVNGREDTLATGDGDIDIFPPSAPRLKPPPKDSFSPRAPAGPSQSAPAKRDSVIHKAQFAACRCRGRVKFVDHTDFGGRLFEKLTHPQFEVCVHVPVVADSGWNVKAELYSAGSLEAGWSKADVAPWTSFGSPTVKSAFPALEGWLRLTYPVHRRGRKVQVPLKHEGEIKVYISGTGVDSATVYLPYSFECLFVDTIPEGIFSPPDKHVLLEVLLADDTTINEIDPAHIRSVLKFAFPDRSHDELAELSAAWNRHLAVAAPSQE